MKRGRSAGARGGAAAEARGEAGTGAGIKDGAGGEGGVVGGAEKGRGPGRNEDRAGTNRRSRVGLTARAGCAGRAAISPFGLQGAARHATPRRSEGGCACDWVRRAPLPSLEPSPIASADAEARFRANLASSPASEHWAQMLGMRAYHSHQARCARCSWKPLAGQGSSLQERLDLFENGP